MVRERFVGFREGSVRRSGQVLWKGLNKFCEGGYGSEFCFTEDRKRVLRVLRILSRLLYLLVWKGLFKGTNLYVKLPWLVYDDSWCHLCWGIDEVVSCPPQMDKTSA